LRTGWKEEEFVWEWKRGSAMISGLGLLAVGNTSRQNSHHTQQNGTFTFPVTHHLITTHFNGSDPI